jgi:hypothetical protein
MVRPKAHSTGEVGTLRPISFLPSARVFREKFARACPSTGPEGYAVRVEDLSKTETEMGSLSLENLGPGNSFHKGAKACQDQPWLRLQRS